MATKSIAQYCDDLCKCCKNNNLLRDSRSIDPRKVAEEIADMIAETDVIQEYFGRIVTDQMSKFVALYGAQVLHKILPHRTKPSTWRDLTFKDLNKLVESDEGRNFGFRHLAMGVTEGNLLSNRGLMVSSELDKTDNMDLSDAPIREVARATMSLPIVFPKKEIAGKKYFDGGLYNNLPTHYFDRHGKHNNVLSIIPFDDNQILGAHTVRDGFRVTAKVEWDMDMARWLRPGSYFEMAKSLITKGLSTVSNTMMFKRNRSYNEMSVRNSFRNIVVRTHQFGTFDFKTDQASYERINKEAEIGVLGGMDLNNQKTPGIFDPEYNDLVRLYENKILAHLECFKDESMDRKKAVLQRAISEYEFSIKPKALQESPFGSRIAKAAMEKIIDKAKPESDAFGLGY